MQFTRHTDSPANVVRSWSPSRIRIGEEWITRSVIVHPRGLVLEWPPDCVEALASEHLEAVFALEPEVVLLGTGTGIEFPAAAITDEFRRRGVGLEVMDTGAACRTYNVLVYEERAVAAALILAPGAQAPG